MRVITKILTVLVFAISFVGIASADSAPPTKLTTFYFQKDGQPFTQPVKFTVKCYGTSAMDGDSSLLKISEFSETCQTYGCKFNTSNVFEAYRQITKYCDLEGGVNGAKFEAKDFLGQNMSGLNCHRAGYTMSTGNKYYNETPKYKDCMDAVRKEYYPGNENFICHKSLAKASKSECSGYGYITIDDICYKFTSETNACIAEKGRKEKLCEQHLEDVTSKLERGQNGYPYDEICEAKIAVPANIGLASSPELPQSKSVFARIADFFKCSLLKLFGRSC